MMSPVFRAIVTLGAAALLASCSGGSSVPLAGQQSAPSAVGTELGALGPTLASRLSGSQSAACDPKYGWSFKGPCQVFVLPYKGRTVTLSPYHGMRVTVKFGQNSVVGNFVVGLGTSDADITGKHYLDLFPVWGSKAAKCLGLNQRVTPCKGKGLLYVLLYLPPTTHHAAGLPYPSVHITKSGNFPGTTCAEASLFWSSAWYWIESGNTAKPLNGNITFRYNPDWDLTLQPGHFGVLAVYCS
jgi:hypothetical protein